MEGVGGPVSDREGALVVGSMSYRGGWGSMPRGCAAREIGARVRRGVSGRDRPHGPYGGKGSGAWETKKGWGGRRMGKGGRWAWDFFFFSKPPDKVQRKKYRGLRTKRLEKGNKEAKLVQVASALDA